MTAEELEVQRSRWSRWAWVPIAVALLVIVVWWVGHPTELPADDRPRAVTTAAGQEVYVGVLGPDHDGSDRALSIRSVDLDVDGQDVQARAWVCIGGSVGQTSDPSRFCEDVEAAEGSTLQLGGGDQLMVSVVTEEPQTVRLDRPEVSYREGIQFATQDTGRPVVVDVVG